MPTKKGKRMKSWQQITHYAGFDWARDHHDVVILDQHAHIVADFQFEHTQAGWQLFGEKTAPFPHLAVAIETSRGPAVDQLLQADYTVYPVNPLAAKSYRQRRAPSGTKTDHLDAWSLAEALRTEGQAWRALVPTDDLSLQLRLLCQDEVVLIAQRTQLVNQLQQALVDYFPVALESYEDWTSPACWDFILEFPTPQALVGAGKRRWEKFLHTHRLWRPDTVAKRLELFARADQFQGSPAAIRAKSQLATSLCKLLRTLQQQLDEYRQKIEKLFADHPDHDLFGSLPGAKKVLAPRLLAAIGGDPDRYGGSVTVLQAFAGTAPISYQSGKRQCVRIRWACDKFMRHTIHLWADCFRRAVPWAKVYYQNKRQSGMNHACAIRCLGQRLLKILFRMLTDKKPYNANLHARNQLKHGSWVLKLVPEASAKAGE
jgi:transposase